MRCGAHTHTHAPTLEKGPSIQSKCICCRLLFDRMRPFFLFLSFFFFMVYGLAYVCKESACSIRVFLNGTLIEKGDFFFCFLFVSILLQAGCRNRLQPK